MGDGLDLTHTSEFFNPWSKSPSAFTFFRFCSYFFTMSVLQSILSGYTTSLLIMLPCILIALRSEAKLLSMASKAHITGTPPNLVSGISYLAHINLMASSYYFSVCYLRAFAHAVSFPSRSSSPLSASLSSQSK